MPDLLRQDFVEQIKEFFFFASLSGYCADAPKTTIAELPGSKVITVEQGAFKMVDVYFVHPRTLKCHGSKTIFYENEPVWFMSYNGWYGKKVIPFLKEVLKQTFEKRDFLGVESTRSSDNTMRYCNFVNKNSFECFRGEEVILIGREILGKHVYSGGMLF